MHLHHTTPLIPSRPLSLLAGQDVWLKMEAFQPPGSFKIRGIGLACQHYLRQGAERFVSSSGGNAGMAVAWAGRQLGVPVIVVVPETTSARAIELLRQENADVIIHGASWQEANQYAQSLLGSKDAFLHPFDDPLLWQGHATMIDEVAATECKPDVVILSVGGGGLLSGVVEGLQRNGWHDVPVVAVETEGAASFHAAVQTGHTVELAAINSVAGSLGAKRVSEQALRCAATHPIHSALVTDSQAIAACSRFLND
ncbi:MAG TPA: serine dehydratase, partial [Erwinia sp.]|nr:serine dehydratase [Erwinia sp.]